MSTKSMSYLPAAAASSGDVKSPNDQSSSPSSWRWFTGELPLRRKPWRRRRRRRTETTTTTTSGGVEFQAIKRSRSFVRRQSTMDELKKMQREAISSVTAAEVEDDNVDEESFVSSNEDECSSMSTVDGLDSDDDLELEEEEVDDEAEHNTEIELLLFHRREESSSDESMMSSASLEDDAASPPEQKTKKKEFDVTSYMNGREMTPAQERFNALTVVPNPLYCLYFLLAGKWLSDDAIEGAREAMTTMLTSAEEGQDAGGGSASSSWGDTARDVAFPASEGWGSPQHEDPAVAALGCIDSDWFPHLHALPPLPVLAAAVGIICHAPFSFLYHWHYAHRLPPGLPRIDHWSRRLDHAFIHFISACMSYATSGRWDYFLVNAWFNVDCMYRQFKRRIRPRRNKIRIVISVVAYTIPIVRRGDVELFVKLWILLGISGWLFALYPIGGWSHSAFHAVVAFVPHLLMTSACHLVASQEAIRTAARCAVMAGS